MDDVSSTSTAAQTLPATDSNDPRCMPIKLTRSIPVGDAIDYPDYSAEEHDVWRTLHARQEKLLAGRAADEFLAGLEALDLDREKIPALRDVSRRLFEATGWQVARTPGLLDAHDFFSHLARRIFPCTDYIRSRSELDYTPAPDCFHDIFGHTPMIVHERFADFYQRIGQAALACRDPAVEEALTRIYWFTVEFGLIRNRSGLRIYGNGIISSSGETEHSLSAPVRKVDFTPELLAAQPYDIWHFQDTLFVIESFDQLQDEFERWARERGLM